MFKFKTVSILFLSSLFVLFLLDIQFEISSTIYWLPVIIYIVCIAWGSAFIQSQFFIESINDFPTQESAVALTFDDGPDPAITPSVLDVLKAHNLKATFFCIGHKVVDNPSLVERIHREGHTIGLHSFTHSYWYDFLPAGMVVDDLQKNQQVIEEVIGNRPVLFRPPYGVTNPGIAKAARRLNLVVVGWTLRSMDTVVRDKAKVMQRIRSRLQPGTIILLHDHLQQTPQVLEELVAHLNSEGITVCALPTSKPIHST